MNNYKSILILHAIDNSTLFLSKFKDELSGYYHSFSSDQTSISQAKTLIGDLEPKSLIVYLGHGSSSGLYEPDDTHNYEKYFLDANWGNHFFDEHDIFLLSCKSNDYIKKIYKSNYSIGFGNIISSKAELGFHNEKNDIKKLLSEGEISLFNGVYLDSSIKVIRSLINKKIKFQDAPKNLRFHINKEINKILLDKKNGNRVELTRMLFELRNQILLKHNLR